MKLTENQITTIVYENETKGETTTRVIIPTSLPKDNVRAIDVDDLSPSERDEMARLYSAYRQYTKEFMAKMFNFEDWAEHSIGVKIEPKWRAFKSSGLKS